MRNPARRERTVTNPATGVASRALQEIAPAGSESDVMTNTDWQDWVGRTESHGCFRLANWNAEYLLKLVSAGTTVYVEP